MTRSRLSVSLAALLILFLVSGCEAIATQMFGAALAPTPSPERFDYSNIHQDRTDDGAFILGDPNVPVTVIAFEDFLCPHCQDYETVMRKFIDKEVVTGHARFEYRFTPAIDPTYSFLMADLAECAETLEPGSFWTAHDVLFEINTTTRFGRHTSQVFAQKMGLDEDALLNCSEKADQVGTDRLYADRLGVTGTPTVFIQYGDAFPILVSPPPSYEQLAALVAVEQS